MKRLSETVHSNEDLDTEDMAVETSDIETEEAGVEVLADSESFPCPGCGSKMRFDPESSVLKCDYCGNTVEILNEKTDIKEYDFDSADELSVHSWGRGEVVMKCASCGAKTVTEESTKATACPFCGSPQVIKTDEKAGIKPESLIPFQITKEQSKSAFKSWIKGKFLAPNVLRKTQKIDGLSGMYIPFFTFDSDSNTAFVAKRGDYYYVTRTRTVNGKTETYRERRTRWRTVTGNFHGFFDDETVDASVKIDDDMVNKIGNFDYSALMPFKNEYLSGFMAEKYSVSLNESWQNARMLIDDKIHAGIRYQVGGDEFRLVNRTTDYGNVKFKHVLLPLWISSYTFKDKVYRFIINGQNGSVSGEYPKSPAKIAAIAIACAGVVFGILRSQGMI